MTDPIADMLNRIRNAQAVNHVTVKIPFSKAKNDIAKILKQKGFIDDFSAKQKKQEKVLDIVLKYVNGEPMILGARRISTPGQRIYTPVSRIQKVRGGSGIMIVSTSQGIVTGDEARKSNTGGEIICEIW
jgi:small subunit ribosomal protein S8